MTDLFLITGFFGAGKTVLLKRLIDQSAARGKSVGAILNEFGGVSLDGIDLGLTRGGQLTEICGVSVFTECGAPPFMDALDRFAQNPVDVLLIEASGFSDPSEMVRMVCMVNGKNADVFNYACAVCVVDCASFIRLVQSVPLVRKQIMSSSLVLVNKADTVDQRTLQEVHTIVSKLHERARIFHTVHSDVPMELLYDTPALKSRDTSGEPCFGSQSGRPDSFVLEGEGGLDRLLEFLQDAGKTVYRAKGYWGDRGETFYIESVNGEVTRKPAVGLNTPNSIVVIARHGRDIRDNFEKHLLNCGITIR